MKRIAYKTAGDYTIAATFTDANGQSITPSSLSVVVTDADGETVFEQAEASIPITVPNAAIKPEATYRVTWAAEEDTWTTWFEVTGLYTPTYEDYFGYLAQSRFEELVDAAQAHVDAAIGQNEVTAAAAGAYHRAIFAVVEILADPPVKAGGWGHASETYAEADTIAKAIRRNLAGTGLLFAGI